MNRLVKQERRVFTPDQMKVLRAKKEDLEGSTGLFVLSKKLFGPLAPIWLSSWKRDGSTKQAFMYDAPTGDLIYTKNEISPDLYREGNGRLDGLCQDLFVSILFQAARSQSQTVILPRDWLFTFLGWNKENTYPFIRIKAAVNRLVNTQIYCVRKALYEHGVAEDIEPMRLLDGSHKTDGGGLSVTISTSLLEAVVENGSWGVAAGSDYLSISRASQNSKTKNQIPKLLYLMLRSHEIRGRSEVPLSWVRPLTEWNSTQQCYNYKDMTKGRLGRAFNLLASLDIIKDMTADYDAGMLLCRLNKPMKKVLSVEKATQCLLSFANPAAAMEEELSR